MHTWTMQEDSTFSGSPVSNWTSSELLQGVRLSRVCAAQLIPENALLFGDPLAPDAPLRAVEIDPFDECNHQCPWCFTKSYRGHKTAEADSLAVRLRNFTNAGGAAVHFSGGGEPLLFRPMYKSCPEYDGLTLLEFTSELGLWTGLITNGLFVDRLPALSRVPLFAFLRVSLDATNPADHSTRHCCPVSHYERIIRSLEARLAERGNSPVPAIGVSFIVDPARNQFVTTKELETLRNQAVGIGLDFVQLKHVHTPDALAADNFMRSIYDRLATFDWGETEFWVHRYRPAMAAATCRISRLIEAWNADFDRFPCCHLYGRAEYRRVSNTHTADREVVGCSSSVCRYASMNEMLKKLVKYSEVRKNSKEPTARLVCNLQEFGFHPYRLYLSAPDLFGYGGL